MLISVSSVAGAIASAVFSKIGAVVAAALVSHVVILRAKVAKAVTAAKAEFKTKFNDLAEGIKAEAEHDEVLVKATIARYEADIRKLF